MAKTPSWANFWKMRPTEVAGEAAIGPGQPSNPLTGILDWLRGAGDVAGQAGRNIGDTLGAFSPQNAYNLAAPNMESGRQRVKEALPEPAQRGMEGVSNAYENLITAPTQWLLGDRPTSRYPEGLPPEVAKEAGIQNFLTVAGVVPEASGMSSIQKATEAATGKVTPKQGKKTQPPTPEPAAVASPDLARSLERIGVAQKGDVTVKIVGRGDGFGVETTVAGDRRLPTELPMTMEEARSFALEQLDNPRPTNWGEPSAPQMALPPLKTTPRIMPSDIAADFKARGIDRQESWSRWVQYTQLNPGMDAKDWYKIYDSVTPTRLPSQEAITKLPEPAAVAKQPWEMTQVEWLSRPNKVLPQGIDPKRADLVDAQNHRMHVGGAIREGKPVPPEVLADYPDLAAKAAPTGPVAPQSAAARDIIAQAEAPIPEGYAAQWDALSPQRRRAILTTFGHAPEQSSEMANMTWQEMANEERRLVGESLGQLEDARAQATKRVMGQETTPSEPPVTPSESVTGATPPPEPAITEAATEPPGGGNVPPREPPPTETGGIPPEDKERQFATHTAESPMGDPVLRKLYDEDPVTYSPITNKRTLDAAAEAVDADTAASRARVMSDDPLDPDTMVDTMAQGIVLMRRAATEKNTKELYELSRHIAERLTSSAQSVQLASTIDKLTPEGLFVYMNRIIKKALEKGQGPTVAKRMQQAAQKEAVKRETKAAEEAVTEAERKLTQARKRVHDVEEAGTSDFVGGKPTTRGSQRARDLEYLIDDSVREVKASLTPADRQAVIKAKAILKQSVAEMDVETANSFLDRAAALDGLAGEERAKALMDLIEEVRQLPEVRAGDVLGGALKPSPRLLKEQAADLAQLVDRTARNVFQSLNSVDRLAVARVKDVLRRTDVELPQGMAEELLTEARNLRGLPKADQAAALNKLTAKIKEYDPVAKELARKRAVADAEARVRQEARQAANDLEALIDAHSRKTGVAASTPADRKAIGQAKSVLSKYGAELPEDMANDFLERARALTALPEAEQADAIRALVDEIKNFDPVKQAKESLAEVRAATARAKQRAKDLEYLANEEVRVAKARAKNVERDAIRRAKTRFKNAGVEMPEELAQSFLDRAEALRGITDEYDQMRAAQSLMRDVNALLPPSKWNKFMEVIGLPRALKAAFDLSFPLRQGIFQLFGHRKEWVAAFRSNIDTFRSEDAAIAADRAYFNRPLHRAGQEAGLEYVDRLGPIAQQEETFITSQAGKIPGARASERAYTTTGNKLRGDVFDSTVMDWLPREVREQVEDGIKRFDTLDELIQATGKTKEDFNRLAQWLNVTTGRGDMGKFLKSNNQWLNALFFAPRFAVSRFQVPYMGLRNVAQNPAIRKTVARDLGGFVVGSTAMLALADQVPGVEVTWDPRSSDFGKIRYGALSIDFLGGYAPLVRYMAQISLGQKMSRGGLVQDVNRLEVLLENFLGTKLAPVPSEVVDMLRGEDALGNPLETWEERVKRVAKDFVPFLASDIWESWQEDGLVGAGITVPVSLFGGSVGAYKTVSDNFDAVARNATNGKIQKWQDLPPAERLKLESSPEVKALLDPGDTGIPMNLRKYLEPQDYESFTQSVDAVKKDWATMPELAALRDAPVVSDKILKQSLTLQQRARFEQLMWENAKKIITSEVFTDPDWKKADTEAKKAWISRVLSAGSRMAYEQVLAMK